MIKPTDASDIIIYKARRKKISALYYQRHRKIIKLAATLDISMKEARKIERENHEEAGLSTGRKGVMPMTEPQASAEQIKRSPTL